jgi:hypothetical protein
MLAIHRKPALELVPVPVPVPLPVLGILVLVSTGPSQVFQCLQRQGVPAPTSAPSASAVSAAPALASIRYHAPRSAVFTLFDPQVTCITTQQYVSQRQPVSLSTVRQHMPSENLARSHVCGRHWFSPISGRPAPKQLSAAHPATVSHCWP